MKTIAIGLVDGDDLLSARTPAFIVHKRCRKAFDPKFSFVSKVYYHPGAEKEQLRDCVCSHCRKPFKS